MEAYDERKVPGLTCLWKSKWDPDLIKDGFNLQEVIPNHGVSKIAGSITVLFIRCVLALGKAVAAKHIFDTATAVLAVPNIRFIPSQGLLFNMIKKNSPAIALILVFITYICTISNTVACTSL